jgi:hypothetical protein
MDTRLLTFMSDISGEGVGDALSRMRDTGIGGATVAVAYHTARDVFPHNPAGQVIYQEGGTVCFEPDLKRYGALTPVEAKLTRGSDLCARTIEQAQDMGMRIGAWIVALHNTRLGSMHPDCVQETAAGDRLIHSLCPSHPEAQAYALALIADVASRGFDHVLVEALSFMPFEHGYHHERALLGLDARTRFLLGVCFCPHCRRAGEHAGADVSRLREWVDAEVRRVLDSGAALTDRSPDREWAWNGCGGELGRYLEARIETVTRLATAAVQSCMESGTEELAFVDHSGAVLGYATGHPESEDRAVDIGWRDGISAQRIGAEMDLATTAYFADPNRLRTEIQAYRGALPAERTPHVILRPMPPDSRSATELVARMTVVASEDVEVVSFYHYGLMRLESLGWIRRALAASGKLGL